MSDAFDLDAYLLRMGHEGPRSPTLSTLRAIHALQPASIPFESLDPFMGRPVRLDLGSLQAKLVGQRRGGYCFEVNTLLWAALEALGFSVTGLSGRVRSDGSTPAAPHGPRTHQLLRVDLDEGAYLADVGFAGHLLGGPIKLERDIEQPTSTGIVRLTGADGEFVLQARLPEGWQDVYWFTLEPQIAADYEVANWFTSTNPASLFHGNFLAERLTADGRIFVWNARVTEYLAGGSINQRVLATADEFADLLENGLGVTPPVDPAEIWARLPKG